MTDQDWRARAAAINGYSPDSPAQKRAEADLEGMTPEGRDALLTALERDRPQTD
jgi:hypothetical protein